jgi:hypothetical protein
VNTLNYTGKTFGGYKIEEKLLHVGVREQKKIEYHWSRILFPDSESFVKYTRTRLLSRPEQTLWKLITTWPPLGGSQNSASNWPVVPAPHDTSAFSIGGIGYCRFRTKNSSPLQMCGQRRYPLSRRPGNPQGSPGCCGEEKHILPL